MLKVQDVSKYFFKDRPGNEIKALDRCSLDVKEAEFVVIIGSNGSGKSTLLNVIAGTYLPDSGTISLDGKLLNKLEEHERARWVGRVFQSPEIGSAPFLTVEENLTIALLRNSKPRFVKGLTRKRKTLFREQLEALEMGLEGRLSENVHSLSGGQRQALAVVMATLAQPKLLLLDEHIASLDPQASERVLKITENIIRTDKLTTLMVTHNVSQALNIGDRLIMLDTGRVIYEAWGEDKKKLTIDDIVKMYSIKTRGKGLADRLLV